MLIICLGTKKRPTFAQKHDILSAPQRGQNEEESLPSSADMTAFNPTTDLPAQVNTVERLALWAISVLYFLHGKEDYPELQGEQTPIVTFQQGMAADGTERAILRISLEVEPDWATRTEKFFLLAKEYSSSTIPASFKTAA